jgi:hypothetical protein
MQIPFEPERSKKVIKLCRYEKLYILILKINYIINEVIKNGICPI